MLNIPVEDQITLEGVSLPIVDTEESELQPSDLNDSEVWVRKGKILEENRQYPGAIEMFDHAIGLNRGYGESWIGKGGALLELERYNESLESYNTAFNWIQPGLMPGWGGGQIYTSSRNILMLSIP